MKRTIVLACLSVILLGSGAAYAGGGCCGMSKKGDQAGACDNVFSKLNLTADQKAKLADLKAECTKAGWNETTHQKFMKGVEAILTPAQRADWKAACDQMSKQADHCPLKSDAKPDTKS